MARRGGFPGGGMPGNMSNLMKQAQRMQRQIIHVAGHTHAARKTASLCHFIASFLFVTLLLCPYE